MSQVRDFLTRNYYAASPPAVPPAIDFRIPFLSLRLSLDMVLSHDERSEVSEGSKEIPVYISLCLLPRKKSMDFIDWCLAISRFAVAGILAIAITGDCVAHIYACMRTRGKNVYSVISRCISWLLDDRC